MLPEELIKKGNSPKFIGEEVLQMQFLTNTLKGLQISFMKNLLSQKITKWQLNVIQLI